MKKTIIVILILCNIVSFAQLVTPLKTSNNIYELQPTPFLNIYLDSSVWELANHGYGEGQFIELGDSTIYCTQIGRFIYIGVVKGDSLLILDSIYNLGRYIGFSTDYINKKEYLRATNFPNIAVYKDTLLINSSQSVYKWSNGFLGSQNKLSLPDTNVFINNIYTDHSDSLILDAGEGLFKFRDTGWHKLVSYSFNNTFYRRRYFKDTLIKSPKVSDFSNNSFSFIVGDSVIKQIPGSIARIIDSSIYFLDNDGFICKYYNGKIERYDADPQNRKIASIHF